jgi:hypothetical protein
MSSKSKRRRSQAKSKPRRSQREGFAYHEAGHAVIAYMQGLNLVKLWIVPANGKGRRTRRGVRMGRCQVSKGITCIHDQAIFALAGPAAETRYWGRTQLFSMFGDLADLEALGVREYLLHFWDGARFRVRIY